MFLRFYILFTTPFIILLTGCNTLSVQERIAQAHTLSPQFKSYTHTATGVMPLYAFVKKQALNHKTLRIYIEGDGYAYATRYAPSQDPTPTNPVMLRLAALDPAPNVLYLARPCQYIKNTVPACANNQWWTTHRYSQEALNIYQKHLNTLKKAHNIHQFELIGYSGGGTLAALLAAYRDDVTKLITIAANLDTDIFDSHHNLKQNPYTLNPAHVQILDNVHHRHLVGAADSIVPARVVRSFLSKQGLKTLHTLKIYPNITHEEGWESVWRDF